MTAQIMQRFWKDRLLVLEYCKENTIRELGRNPAKSPDSMPPVPVHELYNAFYFYEFYFYIFGCRYRSADKVNSWYRIFMAEVPCDWDMLWEKLASVGLDGYPVMYSQGRVHRLSSEVFGFFSRP